MFQVMFEIDKDESLQKDIKVLNKILIDGLASKASVEMFDIRGKSIRSKNSSLTLFRDTQ
jgi:hypothetical protein